MTSYPTTNKLWWDRGLDDDKDKISSKGGQIKYFTKNNKSSEICLFLQGFFVTWCQVL